MDWRRGGQDDDNDDDSDDDDNDYGDDDDKNGHEDEDYIVADIRAAPVRGQPWCQLNFELRKLGR